MATAPFHIESDVRGIAGIEPSKSDGISLRQPGRTEVGWPALRQEKVTKLCQVWFGRLGVSTL